MVFWFLILLITALAVVPVVFSWWRVTPLVHQEMDHDRRLYEARLQEIETDFSLGRIDSEARDAAIAEEGRRLLRLQALTEAQGASAEPAKISRSWAAVAIIVVLTPAFAFSVYNSLGTPPIDHAPEAELADQQTDGQPSIDELVALAEQRLAANPDDARGWRVLAPIYVRMERFEDAANAYRNLIRLDGESPELSQALAEILVVSSGNRVDEEAYDLFSKLWEADQENYRAGYLLGLAEVQRGQFDKARSVWSDMLSRSTGDEPWASAVQARLAEIAPQRQEPSFSQEQQEQINAMVEGLATRLQTEKGEKEDWVRLVRSYLVLNRNEDAADALERARTHFAEDNDFIASLEVMIEESQAKKSSQ